MHISVIIPTYKPKDYLFECLNSMISQTFPKEDFEVIIILNGCCEPYKTKIEKFIVEKMRGMNIAFIHTDIGGVSNARNLALDNAKGEYVAFIDDDDYVTPKYLELLYNKASEDTVALCYPLSFKDGTTDFKPYSITGDYECNVSSGKCNYKRARKFFSGPVYKLIHSSIIGERRFDKRFRNGEDSLFMFLISDRIRYVNFTSKEAVYYRRIRENSAVTIKRNKWTVIYNSLKMIGCYTKMYISSPFSYSINFYCTRLLGAIRTMIVE